MKSGAKREPGTGPSSGWRAAVIGAIGTLTLAGAASAIEFGQVDTFDDGTTSGWVKGGPSELPVTNLPDGGPDGAGDSFIRNESTGGVGPDSRQVFFNRNQWAGDYNTAGVGAITMMVNNLGSTTLYLRVAIEDTGSTRFCSLVPTAVTAGSGWTYVEFDLTAASLTRVSGAAGLSAVLDNVRTVRILSAQTNPAWEGDIVESLVGVDQIRARGTIIPTLERTWGRIKGTFLGRDRYLPS